MRKLLIVSVILSLFAMPAMALDFAAKQFFVQGIVSLPMGDFGDAANLGFGGGLGMMVPHTEQMSFGIEASYLTYSTEDVEDADVSFSMIPVLVVMHYNMTDSPVYLVGGAGLAFGSSKIEFDDPDFAQFEVDDSSSDVAIALGAGFDATPNMSFEARYLVISDANQVTGHIAYKF